MKAAVLNTVGQPLALEDLTLEKPREGEVLIDVTAAGVCHSDLHYMTGDLAARLPMVLGHEGTGVVRETGPGVTRVKPGDTVITMWRPRCGNCEFCTTGRPAMCVAGKVHGATNGLIDGTTRLRRADGEEVHHLMGVSCFAEQAVVNERSLIAIDPGLPREIAAITGCAVATGVGVVLTHLRNSIGEGVVVIGAGGVGLSTIMGLNLIGAHPIVAVDTVDSKLEKARTLGATHTVNATEADLAEELAKVSKRPFKWAVEAVGLPQTVSQAFSAVGVGGTVVGVGLGRVGAAAEIPVNELVQQEKRLIGSLYGSANSPVFIPQIIELYQSGKLPLDQLLGNVYELDRVNDAYDELAQGAIGRGVIVN